VDRAPALAWATLLDEGSCLASESTMYRILRADAIDGGVRERRRQATPSTAHRARARGHPPHGRPHVSDDNPYSEAGFKTLKYAPDFPGRFASPQDARAFVGPWLESYNHEHRHSGTGFHTPASVHLGTAGLIREQRALVLDAAYAAHPERFVNKPPTPPKLPGPAWINPPKETPAQS